MLHACHTNCKLVSASGSERGIAGGLEIGPGGGRVVDDDLDLILFHGLPTCAAGRESIGHEGSASHLVRDTHHACVCVCACMVVCM